MNTNSRTTNVMRNVIGGVGGQLFTTILSFVCRTYFINLLGTTYLGISGLFTNILQMLSLSELGISSAIIYGMYKPIANGDEKKIAQYMNFYKAAYRIIAAVVAVIGLALIPFLDFFISEKPDIKENLVLIYILILSNTVISYLYCFKGSLLNADQKSYLTVIFRNVFAVVQNLAQIFILILTRNFYLYLIVQLVTTFLANFTQAIYVDRKYKFLVKYKKERLEREERVVLFKNVRGMMIHKIGGFVLNGTDNLVISKFVGLAVVGIYSNYLMIVNIIKTYLTLITGSISASVGNLLASEDMEKSYSVYKTTLFIHFWIYGFCSCCFYLLFSPFIELWIGKQFLLAKDTLMLVIMIFYLYGVHRANDAFTNSSGIFWETRKKPIAECIINIVVSVVLAKYIGINGVFIGSVAAYLCTGWIEPKVLYKKMFSKHFGKYIFTFSIYLIYTFLFAFAVDTIISKIVFGNLFLELFVRLIIAVLCFNGLLVALFFRTNEFGMSIQYAKQIIFRYKRKRI